MCLINISVRVNIFSPSVLPQPLQLYLLAYHFQQIAVLSLSLSLLNISICDALWKKPYLRFLQQCCRGFTMIFYKAVFPHFNIVML